MSPIRMWLTVLSEWSALGHPQTRSLEVAVASTVLQWERRMESYTL